MKGYASKKKPEAAIETDALKRERSRVLEEMRKEKRAQSSVLSVWRTSRSKAEARERELARFEALSQYPTSPCPSAHGHTYYKGR
jgi:hypothetical protein